MEHAFENSLSHGRGNRFKSWYSKLAIDLVRRGTSSKEAISFVEGASDSFGELW